MLYKQAVKQIMKRSKVYDVKQTDSVTKAIQLLDECNISALPVRSSEGKFCGVISKSDIASRRFLQALKVKHSPDLILVADVMNRTPPIYVMEEDPVEVAINMMHKRHIHRLFVADNNYELTGVISTTDVIRLLVVGQ
jgi:CBS domain-containing protein